MKILRAAVVVSLALVVSGCSEAEPKPNTLPPAPTASVQPNVVAIPAEAQAATAQGASAFVRHYLEAVNRAFASGDSAPVEALSAPDCRTCLDLIQAIQAPDAPDERIEGGEYVVGEVASTPASPEAMSSLLTYGLAEARVVNASGDVVRTRPAKPPISATMLLRRNGAGWTIASFQNVAS